MPTKTRMKHTLSNTVVLDPVTKRFVQKEHIVHGKKVLDYPIAQCKNCSKDYPKKRVDQEFCGALCRIAWHRKNYYKGKEPNLNPRPCVICGTVFIPTRFWSDKCSDECRAKSRREKLAEKRQVAVASKA